MAAPAVLRVVEREAIVFRRLWRGFVFTSVVAPMLFLAAMGVGLGGMIDAHSRTVGGFRYLVFVAPGLLAASAVQSAAGESLWPVLGGVKWVRNFHGAVATPVSSFAVQIGVLGWNALRTAGTALVFLVVAALFGAIPSWWALLAVPAAVLCSLAFAAPLSAYAISQESDASFGLIMRVGIVPLFLFSGTFFPVSQLPAAIRPLAMASPLWHGAELCRMATTGTLHAGAGVVHVVVLSAFVVIGLAVGRRTFARRLTA
jgi:lipooligosaccharide transport system permease protein